MSDTAPKGGTSAALKRKTQLDDLAKTYSAKKSATPKATRKEEATESQTSPDAFAGISTNTFFKIMVQSDVDPKAKKEAIAKALAFDQTSEEAKKALAEFEEFKAYLQAARKNMARDIIKLTDTDAMAEMQRVYQQINDGMLDFENKMRPLTDIVDAIHKLRMNGISIDVYEEIQRDKEAEERKIALRKQLEERLVAIEQDVSKLRQDNAALGEDRHWSLWGEGRIKADAQEQIARNDILLQEKQQALGALQDEIVETQEKAANESQFDEFATEKAALRELLDLSSEAHTERQKSIVEAAETYIETTEERVGTVLGHLGRMSDQTERLTNANFQIRTAYAILTDATDDAQALNQDKRDDLKGKKSSGSAIENMKIEETERHLEDHIAALGKSNIDTTRVLADLTQSGERVRTMKQSNDDQESNMRSLHTTGVASIADHLSTTLQTVSAAALGEASAAARDSMTRMRDFTTDISTKEAFRVAGGMQSTNEGLAKALDDLAHFGDMITTIKSIRREGLEENKRILADMQNKAESVHEEIREANALAADIVAGKGGTATSDDEPENASEAEQPDQAPAPNPFGMG